VLKSYHTSTVAIVTIPSNINKKILKDVNMTFIGVLSLVMIVISPLPIIGYSMDVYHGNHHHILPLCCSSIGFIAGLLYWLPDTVEFIKKL
jgi:hypothetical protein